MTHARRSPLGPFTALCLLPFLAACGQKGGLYLPGDRGETEIALPDDLDDEEAEREDEEPVNDTS